MTGWEWGFARETMLFGVSCPSPRLCVAVGRNDTVATSTDPTGDASSWHATFVGAGSFDTGPGGGFYNGGQIRGVSCPTTQLCVAVGFEGSIYTSTAPTGGAGAWTATDLTPVGPNTHFHGVSCPTTTFCAAVASDGKVVTSTNPTDVGEILSSANPLGGSWQRAERSDGQGSLFGVSCPSPTLCVTGNLYGNLLATANPTGSAEAWRRAPSGGSVQITDVDCPTATQCVAVNNNADVMTSESPLAGGWSLTNLRPYAGVDETLLLNGTFGVSCPTASFCAVVGAVGTIYTSENPFAATPANPVKRGGQKASKRRHRPKRPRVTIARAPNGAEIEGRKVRLRTFFFAPKHVQVRGFTCKIDDRPVKRCRSPKVFTVGLGKHVFRVWAIGWTGLKGKMAYAKFEVCHPEDGCDRLPRPSAPPLRDAGTRKTFCL